MSNGTLAKLPQASAPEGITPPEGPFVMLLLPHNRCLVGVPSAGAGDSWSWGKPGGGMSAVSLYENEALTLPVDASALISLPKDTVAFLRGELLAQMDPPGSHMSTVLTLKGFMKDHAAFFDDFPFQDEAAFALCLNDDEVLRKAYWALRFDSNFMKSNCRLQSELRAALWDPLHLAVSLPSVPPIVARVSPWT